jgi:hypothetical protein
MPSTTEAEGEYRRAPHRSTSGAFCDARGIRRRQQVVSRGRPAATAAALAGGGRLALRHAWHGPAGRPFSPSARPSPFAAMKSLIAREVERRRSSNACPWFLAA